MVVPVRTQKTIIGNPQSHIIVGTVVIIITAADTVSGFKGTVEPFNHLFVRAELFRDGIIVCEPNYLRDVKLEIIAQFLSEL